MKKILFIILLASTSLFSQVALTSKDSITTLYPYDIFHLQEYVTGTYQNRQMSWNLLRGQISDYLDGIPLTWASIQTFNGANFNAGSHGKVNFADSVTSTSSLWFTQSIRPKTTDTYVLGSLSQRWLGVVAQTVVADTFWVYNAEANDSAALVFDDSTVTISRNTSFSGTISVADAISMDSAATFNVFNYEPHTYLIPTVDDTVMEITTTNLYSLIEIDLPGDLVTGISKFQIDTATKGMILKIYNGDPLYDFMLNDFIGNDDNLYMAGNFGVINQYDAIEFLCVDATKGAQKWIELSRSNNTSP